MHLDLACRKLRDTEDKLKETNVKLNREEEMSNILMEKLNFLQRRFEEKILENENKASKEKVVMTKEEASKDFPWKFIWKIDNYSDILRNAKAEEKEEISSVPFYTEDYGYKLRVLVYPNGFGLGRNTHLSVFVVVMQGEYDAILPWPFNKRLKLSLINQHGNPNNPQNVTKEMTVDFESHFRRPSKENQTQGFHQFISHENLSSGCYIVEDTLFLQVEIRSESQISFVKIPPQFSSVPRAIRPPQPSGPYVVPGPFASNPPPLDPFSTDRAFSIRLAHPVVLPHRPTILPSASLPTNSGSSRGGVLPSGSLVTNSGSSLDVLSPGQNDAVIKPPVWESVFNKLSSDEF